MRMMFTVYILFSSITVNVKSPTFAKEQHLQVQHLEVFCKNLGLQIHFFSCYLYAKLKQLKI